MGSFLVDIKMKIAKMLLPCIFVARSLQAQVVTSAEDFAALVSPTGIVTKLPSHGGPGNLPGFGEIFSVAINASGSALIGGIDFGDPANPGFGIPYAALVSPGGTVVNLPNGGGPGNLPLVGEIDSVAMNDNGYGLIGGAYRQALATYGALVSPGGVLTNLPNAGGPGNLPLTGSIKSIAINSLGNGIIGGSDDTAGGAYATLVSSGGSLNNLPNAGGPGNLPSNGLINSVAINSSGAGLIGGIDGHIDAAYAALVSAGGAVTNLPNAGGPGNLPSNGTINSVAINTSGAGIVGGQDSNSNAAYAAFVSSGGAVSNLPNAGGAGNLPSNGQINSVAINTSGAGIVGGLDSNSNAAYAALISSGGAVTNLPNAGGPGNLPSNGEITSVAINNSGAGIVGGTDTNNYGYAALVSPIGIVTNLPSTGSFYINFINSVAINDNGDSLIGGQGSDNQQIPILISVVPASIGSYDSTIQALFAASFAYQSHVNIQHKRSWFGESQKAISLLADVDENYLCASLKNSKPWEPITKRARKQKRPSALSHTASYTIWIAPFGELVHQSAQGHFPAINNKIAGTVVGFDYHMRDAVLGGGIAYAFDYARLFGGLGHTKINEEIALFYASFQPGRIFINVSLWGGLFQLDNVRHNPLLNLPALSSTSKTHGGIFSPHLEVSGVPYYTNCLTLEPFFLKLLAYFYT